MGMPSSVSLQDELQNATLAEEDIARTGTTQRRCLRCGGELRVVEKGNGAYVVRCE